MEPYGLLLDHVILPNFGYSRERKLELALNDQTMKGNTSSELDAFAYGILTYDFAEIGYVDSAGDSWN